MSFFDDVDMNELGEEVSFSDADIMENEETNDIYENEDIDDFLQAYEETPSVENKVDISEKESLSEKESPPLKTEMIEEVKQEMPTPSPKKEEKELGSTVIAIGTIVEGNIIAKGGLSIDGTVNGNAQASAGLTVFRHGIINGDIIAHGPVFVKGAVLGSVSGDEVILQKTKINGDVHATGCVTVGDGSIIIGDIEAGELKVCGAINGNIDVKGCVTLESTAIVKGNIKSKSVNIINGAAIDGVCSQCYANVNPTAFFENL